MRGVVGAGCRDHGAPFLCPWLAVFLPDVRKTGFV